MPTPIHLFDIYRSANIGIFLRTNDKFCLVPRGISSTKEEKLQNLLEVKAIQISVGGSRLLGPLVAMNNNGMVLSRFAEDSEVSTLSEATGLDVVRLNSRFTSVGNLISANDIGAVISDVFGDESTRAIRDTLKVPVQKMRIASFIQVGAMLSATNQGAVIHPIASEEEISRIRGVLGFEPEPATVNGGVPFVASGFVGNSKSILVGAQTRGAELVIVSKAFSA
ncbi:MAG TPA: translation initiation factor IF-6 [Nitrososphaerales archaeon]|nr:translation initiation factor IF-6 [Nitrososphaerales archaeon]